MVQLLKELKVKTKMFTKDTTSFQKWFRAEVAAAFAVGLAVAGTIIYFNTPISELKIQNAVIQNQISELKSNDLVHIELEQTKTEQRLTDLTNLSIDQGKQLTEILVLIKAQK